MPHKAIWGEHNVLLSHPITKLILLSLFVGGLFWLAGAFPDFFGSGIGSIALLLLVVLSTAYSVALIVRVLIVHLIRRPLDRLLNSDNIVTLVASYALFIFGIILLSSLAFMAVRYLGLGYLTYGQCGDAFNRSMIASDHLASNDYFYFAASTFFTIGSSVCPMGASKIVSILTAFIGNAVTVVLMGIVLALYLNRKRDGKD